MVGGWEGVVGKEGRGQVSVEGAGFLSSLYLIWMRSKGCFVICSLFCKKDSMLVIDLFYFNS